MMNVFANLIVFDVNMHVNMVFLMHVSVNFNVFHAVTDVENSFLMNVSANLMVFDVKIHVSMLFLLI